MRITYIANARIPTEKAHGIQIMKMCEAFANSGAKVTLVVPRRIQTKRMKGQDPFQFYGVNRNFKIKKLPCIDLIKIFPGPASFWLQNWTFMISAFVYELFNKEDIIYTRDEFSAAALSRFRKVAYEAHTYPERGQSWYGRLLKRAHKIVTISSHLKKLHSKIVPKERILVAHDGVDLRQFKKIPSKQTCRKKIKLPKGNIAAYTGHLYKWKGVDTIIAAAKRVKGQIYVVGGNPKHVQNYRKMAEQKGISNLKFVGYVEPRLVPYYLRAADALLLTNPAKYKISKYYTSPLKLFEYMASKNPVLASAVPANKEVLNEKNSVLFTPDNADDFAKKLNWMFKHQEKCRKIAMQAYYDVKAYTWEKRAQNILRFIKD